MSSSTAGRQLMHAPSEATPRCGSCLFAAAGAGSPLLGDFALDRSQIEQVVERSDQMTEHRGGGPRLFGQCPSQDAIASALTSEDNGIS